MREAFLRVQRAEAIRHARSLSFDSKKPYVVRVGRGVDGTPRYVVCPYYSAKVEESWKDRDFIDIGPIIPETLR